MGSKQNNRDAKIIAHIDSVIYNTNRYGEAWAESRCYLNRVTSLPNAYILGLTDALDGIRKYISHHALDNTTK